MRLHGSLVKAGVVTVTASVSVIEVLDIYFRAGASFCALVLGVYGIWKTFFKRK